MLHIDLPAGLPSPPPESGDSDENKGRRQVYYRPSLELALRLLDQKNQFFADESQFGKFDHLVRSLGRDGLLDPSVEVDLVKGEQSH